jgi:hypothetical protein
VSASTSSRRRTRPPFREAHDRVGPRVAVLEPASHAVRSWTDLRRLWPATCLDSEAMDPALALRIWTVSRLYPGGLPLATQLISTARERVVRHSGRELGWRHALLSPHGSYGARSIGGESTIGADRSPGPPKSAVYFSSSCKFLLDSTRVTKCNRACIKTRRWRASPTDPRGTVVSTETWDVADNFGKRRERQPSASSRRALCFIATKLPARGAVGPPQSCAWWRFTKPVTRLLLGFCGYCAVGPASRRPGGGLRLVARRHRDCPTPCKAAST